MYRYTALSAQEEEEEEGGWGPEAGLGPPPLSPPLSQKQSSVGAGAPGYRGRRAIVAMAMLLLSAVLFAGSFAGLTAMAVLLVQPVASALVPAVTAAGFVGLLSGVAVGGYLAHYIMYVSGTAAASRAGGSGRGIPRGYSRLLW